MKRNLLIAVLLLINVYALAQEPHEIITEENVARVMKVLSSDAMMGRSALSPERIEAATAYIENEFVKIGLQPLRGLKGFRQEFVKQRIRPDFLRVIVDGKTMASEDVVIFSDHRQIDIFSGLPVVPLLYDSTVSNKASYFFNKAYTFMTDTTSALMLVAPAFRNNFMEFKGYFQEHFIKDRKYDKIFILAEGNIESYSINVSQKVESIRMNNVAGVIPGKTKPDEIVLFSAHYDHIGIQPAIQGDSIANGADDDASGTTAVIELARYFQNIKNNNRTIIFVAFTAEEVGGYGSQYFSRQFDPEQIVAMLNIEMIGKPSKWGQNAAFITGYERSDLGTILEKNVQRTGFAFKPDPYPEQDLFYRSDNATLARLGVPAHTISTDQIDSDEFYHTVNDEFETIDIRNITTTIRAIATGSRSVIEGADTPSRIDKASVQ
jgi:hypothetical protein